MRSYDVAIASVAVSAPVRWTDNLLAQNPIPGVASVRRGVARRLSHEAVIRLAVIRQLHVGLGIGVADATGIASKLCDPRAEGVYESGQLALRLDVPGLERLINARLVDALESAPVRQRGRPPARGRT